MKQFSGVPYAHPCPVFHRIDAFVTRGGGWHVAIVVVKEGMVNQQRCLLLMPTFIS